jgi:hypothetical protein
MLASALTLALSAAASLLAGADAHGYMSDPAAQFYDATKSTYYVMTITESVNSAFQGKKWDDSPEANTAMFTSSFPSTGYSSLRDMLDDSVSDCGNTRLDVSPIDVTGKTVLHWQNDQEGVGFVSSHHGPCEVWIDDVMVTHQDDCRAAYTTYPANVDADFSQCAGSCTLRFYWLALHEANWQVYKQCVPITNTAYSAVAATVAPADTGCNNRALRSADDEAAPTELENGQAIHWSDHRFLQAFQEFAARFVGGDESENTSE